MSLPLPKPSATTGGSLDGRGSGDHDRAYAFGRRPSSAVPFPFSTRQYVRLLLMRSRLGDASLACRQSFAEPTVWSA
jgi:hypothetical protein